jgi:hypothetical protein
MPDRLHFLRLSQRIERRRQLGSCLALLGHVTGAAIKSVRFRHRHPGEPAIFVVRSPKTAFEMQHGLAGGHVAKSRAHLQHIVGMDELEDRHLSNLARRPAERSFPGRIGAF